MGSVTFKDVTKVFNAGTDEEVIAVNNSQLEVKDGEFLVLVGPSGCGKSTSLRMIAGLERPTEGNIFIGDRDVTRFHPRARNIAMVFQDYALYPHMTVRENLSFGLQNLKYDKDVIDKRVKETSEMLGIDELLDRQPKKLSGGQRQRVALGRAIVRNPEVFLLDEPLSNLDAKLRVQMRVELAELQRRLNTTMIYVTHDQEEAMTLGHRIVVLKDGVIQQIAEPEELYENPANIFVANFIGSPAMNLLEGKINKKDGKAVFITSDQEFSLELPENMEGKSKKIMGKKVYLGIRPENIHMIREDIDTPENIRVKINATAVEMLGPQRLVYFNAGDQLLVASIEPGYLVKATDTIETIWFGEKLNFFDGETGERMEL